MEEGVKTNLVPDVHQITRHGKWHHETDKLCHCFHVMSANMKIRTSEAFLELIYVDWEGFNLNTSKFVRYFSNLYSRLKQTCSRISGL